MQNIDKNKLKNSIFKTFDNLDIYYSFWDNVENPKGVVQIIHGMAEHSGRYDDFAKFLNKQGYIVYATDHREHGRSAKKVKDIGYIKDNDIFNMVKDEQIFTNLIKEKYKDLPFFILGHSMGSFILQKYLQQIGICSFLNNNSHNNIINGAIIMGSAFRSWEYYLGKLLSLCCLKIFGDKRIKFLENIIFYKLHFNIIAKLIHLCITSDKKALKKYEKDKYCTMVFSTKFYYELFSFMIDVFKRYNMETIKLDIPIFIVSGAKDSIGGKSKKIKKLYAEYQDIGIYDVIMKLYENSYHEIIHDKDKLEVRKDIKNWLDSKC